MNPNKMLDQCGGLKQRKESSLWLRIIHINDVYILDNFPSFKTLVNDKSEGPDKTLVVLPGDFLGPSLLSSLDKGRGMVDTLSACGVTHVSFGNHETDVPVDAIGDRIEQSNFCWLNTNMRELDDVMQPSNTSLHDVVEVTNKNQTKKVGLLGLLLNDPTVYRPGSFGGATIEPVMRTIEHYMEEHLPKDLDLVIPLTHQFMEQDREIAETYTGGVFPLIIGGHEHEPFDEIHCGTRIIKTGCDAVNTAVIDIKWAPEESKPVLTIDLIPTNSYAPDQDILDRILGHQKVTKELESARIFRFEDWMSTSSYPNQLFCTQNNRLGKSNGSEVLTSILRMSMRTTIGLTNAGSIRGGRLYPKDQAWFTWHDLKSELPYPTELVVVQIPGSVIEEFITNSRKSAMSGVDYGGYIYHCDKVIYNSESETIESIDGQPFDAERKYSTTIPGHVFAGMDNHVEVLEWARESKLEIESDSGKPCKLAVVEMFSALMWLDLGSFEDIDKGGDGLICRKDIQTRAASVFGEKLADIVTESVLGVADLDGDGTITPMDMMVVRFVASDILNRAVTHDELGTMSHVCCEVLGKRPSHIEVKEVVQNLQKIIDLDATGRMTRDAALRTIGEVRRRSVLV